MCLKRFETAEGTQLHFYYSRMEPELSLRRDSRNVYSMCRIYYNHLNLSRSQIFIMVGILLQKAILSQKTTLEIKTDDHFLYFTFSTLSLLLTTVNNKFRKIESTYPRSGCSKN